MNNRDFISNAEKRRYEFFQKEKTLTNADCIREKMSTIEGMADFFSLRSCPPHHQDYFCVNTNKGTKILCKDCWIEWLSKPRGEELK